jgi:hypothetical protein
MPFVKVEIQAAPSRDASSSSTPRPTAKWAMPAGRRILIYSLRPKRISHSSRMFFNAPWITQDLEKLAIQQVSAQLVPEHLQSIKEHAKQHDRKRFDGRCLYKRLTPISSLLEAT